MCSRLSPNTTAGGGVNDPGADGARRDPRDPRRARSGFPLPSWILSLVLFLSYFSGSHFLQAQSPTRSRRSSHSTVLELVCCQKLVFCQRFPDFMPPEVLGAGVGTSLVRKVDIRLPRRAPSTWQVDGARRDPGDPCTARYTPTRLQGYLAHKKQSPPLGPPYRPRLSPTVGSKEGGGFLCARYADGAQRDPGHTCRARCFFFFLITLRPRLERYKSL